MAKKQNEKAEIHNPTPELRRRIRSDGQFFTYSENQLLDQITIEIMECWKHDLIEMKKLSSEVIKVAEWAKKITEDFDESYPTLEAFIKSHEFIDEFPLIKTQIDQINFRHAEMNKTLFEINEKLNFTYVRSLMTDIEKLDQTTKNIEIQLNILMEKNKKKWWQRIF